MVQAFNNLAICDQQVPQNSRQSVLPDLATSLVVNEDGDAELTFGCASASGSTTVDASPPGTCNAPGHAYFENRRQLAAYAGLAPSPWKSGSINQEQGM